MTTALQQNLFGYTPSLFELPAIADVAPVDFMAAMLKAAEDASEATAWEGSEEDEEGYFALLLEEAEARQAWADECRYGKVRG